MKRGPSVRARVLVSVRARVLVVALAWNSVWDGAQARVRERVRERVTVHIFAAMSRGRGAL